jgi:hypothetical protein
MDQDEPAPPADLQALQDVDDELGEIPDKPTVDPIAQKALLDACASGDLNQVKQAIDAGAQVQIQRLGNFRFFFFFFLDVSLLGPSCTK